MAGAWLPYGCSIAAVWMKHGECMKALPPAYKKRDSKPDLTSLTGAFYVKKQSRVGKGISAQASHKTVREALTSYGSYHIIKRV